MGVEVVVGSSGDQRARKAPLLSSWIEDELCNIIKRPFGNDMGGGKVNWTIRIDKDAPSGLYLYITRVKVNPVI